MWCSMGFAPVFHLKKNYLKRPIRDFGAGSNSVTDSPIIGTTTKRRERLFLQLSIHTPATGYGIRERRAYVLVGMPVRSRLHPIPAFGLAGGCSARQLCILSQPLCHPGRNRSSQSDDLSSGGTLCLTLTSDRGWPTFAKERKGGPPQCGVTGSTGIRNARCSSQYTVR